MTSLPKVIEFEWDKGNLEKIYLKHGINHVEIEEVFVDEKLIILPAIKHTQNEPRYIAVGKSSEKKILHVVFTIRNNLVRVISARRMHRKEVEKYEKIKKDSTF